MAEIDLNSDLGEAYGPWAMGDDAAMLRLVTSANVACGGHAGDPEVMFDTMSRARDAGVVIGAHPGYADPLGFGRRVIPMSPAEITRMVAAQVGALMGVAALSGARVGYVKAHGALANLAAAQRPVADAVAAAVAAMPGDLALLAIAGTELEAAGRATNLPVYAEIFADRGYLASGQLVPRGQAGAMIHDADQAADRLLRYLDSGLMPVVDGDPIRLVAQSVCVHGDSPGAVEMARTIRDRLGAVGVGFAPFLARAPL